MKFYISIVFKTLSRKVKFNQNNPK